MARPIKEGMDYFPHDVNAVNDKKIEALRALYGNDGYAFYFIMLEQIYQEKNFEIDISDTETKEEIIQILAKKVSVTVEVFEQMLRTALKWDCFDKKTYTEKGILTSEGIKKRAGVVVEKRERMRNKYHSEKRIISDTETKEETEEETPQSKVKKSKVKESIYNILDSYSKNDDLKQALKDFLEMRKKIKKPMTERALNMLLSKLDELADTDEMKIKLLDQSILHNWQTVYPLKDEKQQDKPKQQGKPNKFHNFIQSEEIDLEALAEKRRQERRKG